MIRDITIVTAYFDIDRKNWKGFERSNNDYINYFKFWARIKNNLIVYTSKEFVEDILNIRKNFGLEKNTKVIVIDNVFKCDEKMYEKMKCVMENEILLNFHFPKEKKRLNAWNVNYNYITYLKTYFVNKAIEDYNIEGVVAWWDFGLNHGGKLGILDPNDFDFEWKYNFSNKIHLFSTNYYKVLEKDRPIFDMVRAIDSYIWGGIVVAPVDLWKIFGGLVRESMLSLLRCGLCETEELCYLMAYYEKPEIFHLHDINCYYDAIKCFGGEHLKVKNEKLINKYYQIYRYRARILWGYGYYKLALKYYMKYIKIKIKGL